MKVFVAGATGAVGGPLVARLIETGHDVVGTTRREGRAADLRRQGVEPVIVDALDADALAAAVRRARPEVVVQQLSALPRAGTAGANDHAATSRLRVEGTRALLRGAPDARMIAQSFAPLTRPDGRSVHDEDADLYVDGPGSVGVNARALREMEADVGRVGGLSLHYGFFYGPGTWYHRDGASAREIAEGRIPIVGDGRGRWSWIHVDDAVTATMDALERGQDVLNVCDDEPAPMAEWLPHAARVLGADPPPRTPASLVHQTAGPELVHYGTKLPGASNARAKAALGWVPAWPSWRRGFERELGDPAAQTVPGHPS
ncbi:MAG TPA: NAD(P)-dependent oxidoreductase [Rubrobacter sp.]|nr:NAD(P)-dependent oxidoreductase [Rubrobacter sp.]